MTLTTILENLDRTIEGKLQMLHMINRERTMVGLRDGEDLALKTTAEFLTINIDELKKIQEDVKKVLTTA
jgi:hypothetical protein